MALCFAHEAFLAGKTKVKNRAFFPAQPAHDHYLFGLPN
jgi:hypothetical protein